MTRRRVFVISSLAVPVIGLAWWLGSPLFLDQAVDEDFPRTVAATIPDSMTRAEVENVMASLADRVDEMSGSMPEGALATALQRGEFRDADRFHRGSGTATIYRLPGGELVLRLETFEVTNGPDLRVLIAAHPDPTNRSDLEDSGFVEIGGLKGNVGNQNYSIPPDVDVEGRRSVVIYCRPFHVVFSVAALETVSE